MKVVKTAVSNLSQFIMSIQAVVSQPVVSQPKLSINKSLGCIVLPILSTLSVNAYGYGDYCTNVDTVLAENLDKMYSHSIRSGGYDDDKNEQARIVVYSLLDHYLSDVDSMKCPFNKAKKQGLTVLDSEDKKLRVYSWDTDTGGTMRDYAGMYQFIDSRGSVRLQDMQEQGEEEPLHSFPNALFTTYLNGQATYLLVDTGVYSTMENSQYLTALTINNSKITPTKVIKTKSGLTTSLGFNYDFFSVADRPERPVQLFEFDRYANKISFPVVVADPNYPGGGKVTNSKIEYKFDGQYFVRVKN